MLEVHRGRRLAELQTSDRKLIWKFGICEERRGDISLQDTQGTCCPERGGRSRKLTPEVKQYQSVWSPVEEGNRQLFGGRWEALVGLLLSSRQGDEAVAGKQGKEEMATGEITTLPSTPEDGGSGGFPPGNFKDPKRLYCKNGGFFLRIKSDGGVDGIREKNDPHSK